MTIGGLGETSVSVVDDASAVPSPVCNGGMGATQYCLISITCSIGPGHGRRGRSGLRRGDGDVVLVDDAGTGDGRVAVVGRHQLVARITGVDVEEPAHLLTDAAGAVPVL